MKTFRMRCKTCLCATDHSYTTVSRRQYFERGRLITSARINDMKCQTCKTLWTR